MIAATRPSTMHFPAGGLGWWPGPLAWENELFFRQVVVSPPIFAWVFVLYFRFLLVAAAAAALLPAIEIRWLKKEWRPAAKPTNSLSRTEALSTCRREAKTRHGGWFGRNHKTSSQVNNAFL